jgi:hypothetical protein
VVSRMFHVKRSLLPLTIFPLTILPLASGVSRETPRGPLYPRRHEGNPAAPSRRGVLRRPGPIHLVLMVPRIPPANLRIITLAGDLLTEPSSTHTFAPGRAPFPSLSRQPTPHGRPIDVLGLSHYPIPFPIHSLNRRRRPIPERLLSILLRLTHSSPPAPDFHHQVLEVCRRDPRYSSGLRQGPRANPIQLLPRLGG